MLSREGNKAVTVSSIILLGCMGLFRVAAWVLEVHEREAASILDWNGYLVYEILGKSRTSAAFALSSLTRVAGSGLGTADKLISSWEL